VKQLLIVGAIVIVLIIAGYFFMQQGGNQAFNNLSGGANVATVNGVGIKEDAYQQSISNITTSAVQQGADVNDPTIQELIEEEALTGLINNELLLQGAAAAGITVDPEQVQSEYDLIAENIGGAEELNARMEELGVSEEQLQEDIREQLVINDFITAGIDAEDLTVTDEEARAFYDSLAGSEGLPAFEEISDQITAQLQSQKQQEAVGTLIESLREAAEIEVLI
jgi:FKBP-type peptidyl-prolyl cis-trans isomerase (trigger factor)